MTFQRAPPEVKGFGVMTSTPGLVRSFQLLMCFGFPGPDGEDYDGVGDHAVVLVLVPVGGDDPRLHQALHVGVEREHRDIGLQAAQDERLWLPDAP